MRIIMQYIEERESYLAEERQHVVQLILQFFLRGRGRWMLELGKQLPQVHKSKGIILLLGHGGLSGRPIQALLPPNYHPHEIHAVNLK